MENLEHNEIDIRRLAFINRQPTLWRHGIPVVELVPSDDDDDNTIGLSNLTLAPMNGDFDGDSMAIYAIHDNEALKEMYEYAYLKKYVHYDQNNNFLATLRHEALYSAFIITQNFSKLNRTPNSIEIERIDDLPEDIELYNTINTEVLLNGESYSYGIVLFNKWCGFNEVIVNYTISKNEMDRLCNDIYNYFNNNSGEYYDHLTELSKNLLFYISVINDCPTIDLEDMVDVLSPEEEQLFKKLPDNNIPLGYVINEALVDKCVSKMSDDCKLFKLYKSGSRFSKTQLARSALNCGYIANAENIIDKSPITTNLLSGMNEEEFFRSSIGTRKG